MSNNVTGSPGPLVPVTGPGGRDGIGPSFRQVADPGGGSLFQASQKAPSQAGGAHMVVLSATKDAGGRGFTPAQTFAPKHATKGG